MPEINATLITQELEATVKEQDGSLSGVLENKGSISGVIESSEGELTGALSADKESIVASLSVKNSVPGATLDVHYGIDGKPGKDGFSPLIDVHKNTEEEYILKITDVRGSFLTPNLKSSGGESADCEGKVDEDLLKYSLLDVTKMNVKNREESFLYVRRHNVGENNKIPLSVVALQPEVEEMVKNKLRTVQERPTD